MQTTTRLKPLAWRRYLREALILLAIFTAVHFWQTRNAASGSVPPFEGITLDGTPLGSAQLAGRPVMLHFWATWCGVCRAEQGNVEAVAKDGGVVTIASSSGEAERIRRFLRDEGLTFPVIVDADGELARRFGVSAFPTTFFLTPEGDIRFTEVGYTTTLGMRARRWLAGL